MSYRNWAMIVGVGLALALVGQHRDASAAEDGAKVFRTKCGTCHTVEKGKHRVGPSLAGVYGRKAGTADGYSRYVGLKGATFAWDAALLDQYLTDPEKFVKAHGGARSSMAFKLPKAEDRQAVIEYLKTAK